jgi:hypothetical protein
MFVVSILVTGRTYSIFLALLVLLICSLQLAGLWVYTTSATQYCTHSYSAKQALIALMLHPSHFKPS